MLALYARLLFTNRVLAGGDIQLYFYAYWEYVAATLREGRLPFWNPYLFLGAPLLANPQTAVLYPLHWPLIWLPVTRQIYWSAALHTWLLALGGYALLRHWGYRRCAGADAPGSCWPAAASLAGCIGHINQLNGAAWLHVGGALPGAGTAAAAPDHAAPPICWPCCLAVRRRVCAHSSRSCCSPATRRRSSSTSSAWASGWSWPLLAALAGWLWAMAAAAERADGLSGAWSAILAGADRLCRAAWCIGALLAAPQLLPTLELSGLGLRSGGLSYGEASSFSLKPLQLAWTLLPSYGLADLSAVFDTPGYTEFVAYVGVIGLALAVLGAWQGQRAGAHLWPALCRDGALPGAGALESTLLRCSIRSSPASISSARRRAG